MSLSKKTRDYITQRDNYTCQVCKQSKTEHGVKLHVDHMVSRAHGGSDDISNLITLCQNCNNTKSWHDLTTFIKMRENAKPLQKARLEKHLTKKQVAKLADMQVITLSRAEEGYTKNRITISKICGVLGLNWQDYYPGA